jgi:hypothetical protein
MHQTEYKILAIKVSFLYTKQLVRFIPEIKL